MAVDGRTLGTEEILANAAALGPDIEACADRIAAERRLPDELVARLRDAGVFRIAFPRTWGGPEMDIISQCRLIEQLAYHDASVAWVVMICSDSGHYAARLPEDVARVLYPSLDLLTAGLLFPVGRAERTADGFRVSGRWAFGSGCLHADRIVGGCLVYDGGELVLDDEGGPEYLVLWLPREEIVIHDTWHTTGLAGSGSNDYEVDAAVVPAGHTFNPFQLGGRPETLYAYHGFFFANLAGVAIGAAQRMIDDLAELARHKVLMPGFTPMKDDARVQSVLAESTAAIGAARAYQDARLAEVWETLERGDELTLEHRASVGLVGINAAQSANQVAQAICDAVGSSAIYTSSPFERRRRDLATLTAHVVAARKTYAAAGRLLLGDLPPFSMF